MNQIKFAARLNAFKIGANNYWPGKKKITTLDLIERAAEAGVTAADLNYPDHFHQLPVSDLRKSLEGNGMILNGVAMRYYTEPEFKLGAFTHPNSQVRRRAIDQTKKGIDALVSAGGKLMTLWIGQDGFDYSFQADYSALWDWSIEAIMEIADHNSEVDIALEYKPNEPKAFALMPDVATTILAIKEIGRNNTGVTLDFAHALYADEMPAFSANLIARHSRILGVHLNDGYGKWDNGLMVGSIHPIQTIELLVELQRFGYDGAIYFDTFPDNSGLDPVNETKTNIRTVKRFMSVTEKLVVNTKLLNAIKNQDATNSVRIIQDLLIK